MLVDDIIRSLAPRSLGLAHRLGSALLSDTVGSLTLKPVDPADPPEGLFPPGSVRGIVIYWRPAPPRPVKRPRRRSLQLPLPVWQAQHVSFHEVAPSGADEPPRDAEEQERFVRLAYALVACSHPIPSDAEVCYQVWW